MNRRFVTPLRATLAAAALLGLSGTIAPGYAQELLPDTPIALEEPVDVTQPRFAPQADDSAALADDAASDADGETWEQYGSGMASWYGPKFKGRKTASGEIFDPTELTAAHRTLPFGTRVRVTRGGKSVVVRINDRGPFVKNRVIDLSRAAAKKIGLIGPGHGKVTLAVLGN
jgi:rare lipoprotein A